MQACKMTKLSFFKKGFKKIMEEILLEITNPKKIVHTINVELKNKFNKGAK